VSWHTPRRSSLQLGDFEIPQKTIIVFAHLALERTSGGRVDFFISTKRAGEVFTGSIEEAALTYPTGKVVGRFVAKQMFLILA
jgi:hypothetical protein